MLDFRWSHNPPTCRRTVAPNWYLTYTVPIFGLQSSSLSSLSQNDGIEQKPIEGRRNIHLAVNYILVCKESRLKIWRHPYLFLQDSYYGLTLTVHVYWVLLVYSSTDNFLSPVPVFDWLIFCCANLILYQKRNDNDKKQFFWCNKKYLRCVCKHKVAFFPLNSSQWPVI